jgi:CheY-like chemotaxis protein
MGETSAQAALERLAALRDAGDKVALIICYESMRAMPGSELLARTRSAHPDAKRILLIDYGDQRMLQVIAHGMALGHVEYYLTKPWRPRQHLLYPVVGEALVAWTRLNSPGFALVRIVGDHWDPVSFELRDALERNRVPYGFYDRDSAEGAELLGQLEAPAVKDQDVFIVGAGNSAGQAAIYLARSARSVTLVVRGDSLAKSMSDYLVQEIESTPAVLVRLQTEVAAARGERRLTGLVLRDRRTGSEETVPAAALFVMIGATPHADWLPDDVVRDQHGFILTGRDLAGEDEDRAGQPVPLPLETNMPGVFAVGDVRAGSVKRVASAVGEGSVAIPQIHQHLLRQASRAAS